MGWTEAAFALSRMVGSSCRRSVIPVVRRQTSGAAEKSGTPEPGTEKTKPRDDKKWDGSLRSLSWSPFFCPPSFCPPLPNRCLTTAAGKGDILPFFEDDRGAEAGTRGPARRRWRWPTRRIQQAFLDERCGADAVARLPYPHGSRVIATAGPWRPGPDGPVLRETTQATWTNSTKASFRLGAPSPPATHDVPRTVTQVMLVLLDRIFS